eukprot:1414927-Karenia_brevis.AAC.1
MGTKGKGGVHAYGPGISAKEALGKVDPNQINNDYEETLDDERVKPGDVSSFKYNRGKRAGESRTVKLLNKVHGPTGTKLIVEETHPSGKAEERQYWCTGATEVVYPDTP